MNATNQRVDASFRMPDAMWHRIEGLLPKFRRSPKGGRPRAEWRPVIDGIFYVLRTGCQWSALPPEFGSKSTIHRYFQLLVRRGIFHKLWTAALEEYDNLQDIDWEWQSMGGAMTKAPLGGEKTGTNPTDRAKGGTNRSLQTDGNGIPIGLALSGANTHDKRLVKETLDSQQVFPQEHEVILQHMCLDKGYDYRDVLETIVQCGYEPHILARGDERKRKLESLRCRARRWVCERTHFWMNRFRRILIRREKKVANYEAMLHLACAYISCPVARVLGYALNES